MRQRLLLLGLLACVLACDSSNPVAPSGTVLTISASPPQVDLNGSSLITVTGFKPDGNPLNPGTQILFSLDGTTGGGGSGSSSGTSAPSSSAVVSFGTPDKAIGVIVPTVAEVDSSGRATATFTAQGDPGTATITAETTSRDASVSITVDIGVTSKPTLTLTASPDAIGLKETSSIRCLARNADGSVMGSGGTIILSTTLGVLAEESLVTDANGQASTILEAGLVPGTATITGSVGASDEVTTEVTIESRKPQLEIFANPSSIPVLGESQISILARDNNDVPLGAGHRINLFADLGSVPDTIRTDSQGRAEAVFTAGTQGGTGSVTAILGNSDPVTTNIQIRDAASSVNLTANPTSIVRGDASIELTVVVRNAQGEGVQSILVTFEADLGTLSQTGVQTNTRGEAESTLTITQAELPDTITQFDVRASVISEGETLEDSVTISVQ